MHYDFSTIEKKWQAYWETHKTNKVDHHSAKPKFYVLDMFPYPSGAGLHVGHPIGYIASDIINRYKRLMGFNVLHPMGYDAFGLPAEQYALEHKIHPAVATENNINNFRQQLKKIGLGFDWDRELKTCDPIFYKWTQWIFIQLFNSYFDKKSQKAKPIQDLINDFELHGNQHNRQIDASQKLFSAQEWQHFNEKQKADILMNYRLMYSGYGYVNWCEELGTVLANDEVENGLSKRGHFPIERKALRQWYLRITEYAERLLSGLDQIDFSSSLKEMQTNWIGRSEGAVIYFKIVDSDSQLAVFTTRPDTLFGVDFMVVAPEHDLVLKITPPEYYTAVTEYLSFCASKTEVERQKEKQISGCFTGAYVLHPITQQKIPIWISEYVLVGYGTGAIMAVPCGDERDFNFAQYFKIPITNILGDLFDGIQANPTKNAILFNSEFVSGKTMNEATQLILNYLEKENKGYRKINYRIRDAAFSRQRYWGEPIPIRWENDIAKPLSNTELPLVLPILDSYQLDKNGEGVLAQVAGWKESCYDTLTMPGAAGSSWYFIRYMDNLNTENFVNPDALHYWNQVDLYIGGTEHATGHLLYSRMWTKVLYDLGFVPFDEPYKKLINQGMIQAFSWFCYLDKNQKLIYPFHLVGSHKQHLIRLRLKYAEQYFIHYGRLDDHGKIPEDKKQLFLKEHDLIGYQFVGIDTHTSSEFNISKGFDLEFQIDKMSKSKYNVVNPDTIIEHYGADTFRLYEMFLGPLEQSKPWDTKGIEGVHRFLKKLWRLFYHETNGWQVSDAEPSLDELKTLHRTIKKIYDDIEKFSFNTAVSNFMIAVNELHNLQCYKKAILEPLIQLLAPFAPHITEELWQKLGNPESIFFSCFPSYQEQYIKVHEKEYPISINGKVRTFLLLSLDLNEQEIKPIVLENEIIKKWVEGQTIKKIIFIKNKMINIVI